MSVATRSVMRLLGARSLSVTATRTARASGNIATSISRSVARRSLGKFSLVSSESTQLNTARSDNQRTYLVSSPEYSSRQFSARRNTHVVGTVNVSEAGTSTTGSTNEVMEALEKELGSPISSEPLVREIHKTLFYFFPLPLVVSI